MLNLYQVERFLERLPIRDRDSGRIVNFRLNPNQKLLMHRMQAELYAKGKPLWVILLKSRRVGGSALADALLTCHGLSKEMAEALIVAHQYKSSTALFQIPKMLVGGLPFSIQTPNQHKIVFPHPRGPSTLSLATAGSTQGGRGLTLSALHLSEAAFFGGPESFTSLIPAVSYDPSTILIIESTANGRVGPGEQFYQYWQAAQEGRNEFLPVFLGWLDDPGAFRPATEAKDAPVDAEERDLIKLIKARRDHSPEDIMRRVAWRRWALETRCQGYIELFHQEFPVTPEEAFVSTGEPAFEKSEMLFAKASVKKPSIRGRFRRDLTALGIGSSGGQNGKGFVFDESSDGEWLLWDKPVAGQTYFIGADAARGEEIGESGQTRATGDFAAIVIWNGSTGQQVARYAERTAPERLAGELDMAGRYFNRAMISIELTGNLGLWCQTVLRDRYQYPNLYRWKGKDDRVGAAGHAKRAAIGWETTMRTREIAFSAFRAALREERVFPRDQALVTQMDLASRQEGFRWDVIRGHDDILMAAMIGWVAREQYAPVQSLSSSKPDYLEGDSPEVRYQNGDVAGALRRHFDKIVAYTRSNGRMPDLKAVLEDRLAGV